MSVFWLFCCCPESRCLTVLTAVYSLSAGFDTIIAGLQWSLLYLVKFPNIQDRIYQEIGNVQY